MRCLQRSIGLGVMWTSLVAGCVGPSKEIGASAETGAETTSDPEDTDSQGSMSNTGATSATSATSATDPTGATQAETTTDADTEPESETTAQGETTDGPVDSCEDATNEAQCTAIDNELETCGWVPTVVVAGGGCEPVETGFEGECVLTSQADTCTGAEFSTCPDGETRVYFRNLGLEIGAVELVAFDSSFECAESAMGFEPCVMIEGETITFDPPECGCLCPQF